MTTVYVIQIAYGDAKELLISYDMQPLLTRLNLIIIVTLAVSISNTVCVGAHCEHCPFLFT